MTTRAQHAARLDRIGLVAALLLAPALMHTRSLSEVAIGVVVACFLARSVLLGSWRWLRTPWLVVGLVWWAWLVVCSIPPVGEGGVGSLVQALATLRFLVFVAALEHAVLATAAARRWLRWVVILSALYVAIQTLFQFITGRNLYGYPRWGDGELTGPFEHPRAGGMYARLLFPAMLPAVAAAMARTGRVWRGAGAALALGGIAVAVLIGQRIPLLLVGLGLAVTALLLPRLRTLVLVASVAALALVGASAVVSPRTFYRLVTKFSAQMEDFPDSPYGQIAARAVAMAEANPWTGRGFDGFRTGCADPDYFHGWRGGDGGGAAMCVQHPHNHYLQAVTDAGIPGLVLFCALVLAWLATLGRGLWRDPDPLRVGLFVAALMQEWPIASASAFTSMPLSGWFFLLLGWGLAETRWRQAVVTARPPPYIAAASQENGR